MAQDDANLVSEIKISGADQATSDLTKLGDAGEKAFNQIGDAADKAGASVAKSSDKISNSLDDISKAAPPVTIGQRIQAIGTAAQGLGGTLKSAGTSVAEFGVAIVGIGAAGVAAVAGVAKFAASITATARGVNDNTDELLRQQMQLNKSQVSAAGDAAQYRVSVNKLNRDLAAGTITVTQYNAQLTELKQSYKDQQDVQEAVEAAQADLLKQNQKLQQQAAERTAYNELARTYGTTLTNSLITLGGEAERVQFQLRDAFGPVLAQVVDRVLGVIQNNSTAITAFIDQAAAAMQNFLTANGPTITSFINQVGQAAKSIAAVVIGVLIPAFQSLLAILDSLASAINSAFGTDINGTFLLLSVTLLKVTGGFTAFINVFKAVFAVIRVAIPVVRLLIASFTPWGAAITLLVAALTLLASVIDWGAFANGAVTAGQTILTALIGIPARIEAAFNSTFTRLVTMAANVANAIVGAWQAVVVFFTTTLPQTVSLIFTTLWAGVTTGVQQAVAVIVAAWQAFLLFVISIPDQIVAIFTNGFNIVATVVQSFITLVQGYFQAFITFVTTLPDQIISVFTTVTTSISNLFQQAFDTVKGYLQTFVSTALTLLQPVLDLLNAIASAGGSAAGDQPQFASGGHVGSGPVRGPGTSMSDSIFAWLSNHEFVMRAKAVRKYGLGFMNAINSGKLDLRDMLGSMAGFAAGGLVSAGPSPAFAARGAGALMLGGGTGDSRTLNLTIDGQTFEGLTVPESVADRMTKFAITKNARSAGRRPSWVGGNR